MYFDALIFLDLAFGSSHVLLSLFEPLTPLLVSACLCLISLILSVCLYLGLSFFSVSLLLLSLCPVCFPHPSLSLVLFSFPLPLYAFASLPLWLSASDSVSFCLFFSLCFYDLVSVTQDSPLQCLQIGVLDTRACVWDTVILPALDSQSSSPASISDPGGSGAGARRGTGTSGLSSRMLRTPQGWDRISVCAHTCVEGCQRGLCLGEGREGAAGVCVLLPSATAGKGIRLDPRVSAWSRGCFP